MTSPSPSRAERLEALRLEVRDKLAVAFHHGQSTVGVRGGNVLEQCEEFIVEQLLAALAEAKPEVTAEAGKGRRLCKSCFGEIDKDGLSVHGGRKIYDMLEAALSTPPAQAPRDEWKVVESSEWRLVVGLARLRQMAVDATAGSPLGKRAHTVALDFWKAVEAVCPQMTPEQWNAMAKSEDHQFVPDSTGIFCAMCGSHSPKNHMATPPAHESGCICKSCWPHVT